MRPHERWGRAGGNRPDPGNTPPGNCEEVQRHSYGTPHRRHSPASGTKVTPSDVAAWLTFALLTAAVVLAGCLMLVLIWPVTP